MDIIISTNHHEVMQINDDSAWLLCAKLLLEPISGNKSEFVNLEKYLDSYNKKKENSLGQFTKNIAPLVDLAEAEITKIFTTQYFLADTKEFIEKQGILKNTGYGCKTHDIDDNFSKKAAFDRIEKHLKLNDSVAMRFAALSGSQKDKANNVIWVSSRTQENNSSLVFRESDCKIPALLDALGYELKEICYIKKTD